MESNLLKRLYENLDQLFSDKQLKERKIILFGHNEPAECIMEYLDNNHITLSGIVDNNALKQGTIIHQIQVSKPEKLLQPFDNSVLILIASIHYSEMLFQLQQMGYVENVHVFKAVEKNSGEKTSLSEEEFEHQREVIIAGERVYKKIKEQYGKLDKIFILLPFLGDTYVCLAYLKEFRKKQHIDRYILVSEKSGSAAVAELFGMKEHVFMVNEEEWDALIQFAVFMDGCNNEIMVLSHRLPYTCSHGETRNYKGITFNEDFKYGLYGLEEDAKPERSSFILEKCDKLKVEEIFRANELEYGKTVVLFPYAQTAPKLEGLFWECLAAALKEKGYSVCTNSAGDLEPAIKGTSPVSCPIRIMGYFIEQAGYMIALRSGACDVVSGAKAKKIILYPHRIRGQGTFFEYFSLNRMGLCQDAVEIEVKSNMTVPEALIALLFKEMELNG